MHTPDLFVQSSNVRLAVYTWGDKPSADKPRDIVVLAHGFPDRALFWEQVAAALQRDFYVVAYDMRGCANSTHIKGARHYRFALLLADLYAVIDAVSAGRPVHLVGHDWGGIYGWDAIADPEGARRIASLTTLSPSLDQIGFYLRRRLLRPTPRHLAQLVGQLMRNSLMTFFTAPLLPELLFASGLAMAMFRRIIAHYEPRITFRKNDGMEGDAIRYLGIYRANLLQRVLRPRKRVSTTPVHALMAIHDPFLPPALFEGCREFTTRYSESTVDAAHWAPLSRPQEIAETVGAFVRQASRRPDVALQSAS
ncbi:alpha/beta hydrolase [Burkholderia pseudomallei]|uniref:alpha/beta fold hydrolase n=1 Tax=Burkholderia pseudomallei TaxID=28450 RepID=UPI000980F614|nr:alpha/beta fold hydrolase [Burkholderia pseudomallei]MBF3568551.1 alpha/beta fold hydrolase [Burkholderia pseudomallei]OMR75656.1 alpha/beta hydrolase [Burkholderia pseudomallei]CAJ3008137.1 alpha/beta hydrolase [Burkholderia pseudomallei]VBI64838.1 alpha/beta hydrolase [Burkholderia pseudomallei]VBQ91908.1 alpha/beta hydrolase [Burkholderia pseudomallei]